MLPATLDLTAYRGDTWSQSFRFMSGDEPFEFTGAWLPPRRATRAASASRSTSSSASMGRDDLAAEGEPTVHRLQLRRLGREGRRRDELGGGRLLVERDVTNELSS